MDSINKIPKVSLIMPVYNVEKYIENTLNSIIQQTLKDIEVIIVDDGSSDQSISIVENFIKRYDHFKFIKQENKGPSAARNIGLKEAKGEYIAFIDSDDYMYPTHLENLYNLAKKTHSDIACCNYTKYFPNTHFSFCIPFTFHTHVVKTEKCLKRLILDITFHHYVWNKIFKRTLFTQNNIEFPDMYFEDIATLPRLFYYANQIVLYPKILYDYTQRKGSILRTMDVSKINDYTKSLGIISNFIHKKDDYNKYRRVLKIFGFRVSLVNVYSIYSMHLKAGNFNGFLNNVKKSKNATEYFTNDNYSPTDQTMVQMPYEVESPYKKEK